MRIEKLPKKLGKILVSLDSANVSIGLRNQGLFLDYGKFYTQVRKLGTKTKIIYYGPKFESPGHNRFLGFLKKTGYKLSTKEVKVIKPGGHRKANFDVELTIDAVDLRDNFNTFILLSGDSDFAPLVVYLRRNGKRVFVLSTRGAVSKELVDESDGYLPLNEWKAVVAAYRGGVKKSPRR